ncbi:MAG: cupin domain-containing protein [Parcubacteria group bacterium]|nr:cupin domain-containing protein [Parcubacteria group bacterium]
MPKSVLVQKSLIEETLDTAATDGKKLLEPLKSFAAERGLPLNILEDKDVSNDAEVHMHEADMWHCLEGEVTFICGGEMVDPWFGKNKDGSENRNEIKAKEIRGGTTSVLKPGDWLFIPAGEPHRHICKGTARLVVIKIPDKDYYRQTNARG